MVIRGDCVCAVRWWEAVKVLEWVSNSHISLRLHYPITSQGHILTLVHTHRLKSVTNVKTGKTKSWESTPTDYSIDLWVGRPYSCCCIYGWPRWDPQSSLIKSLNTNAANSMHWGEEKTILIPNFLIFNDQFGCFGSCRLTQTEQKQSIEGRNGRKWRKRFLQKGMVSPQTSFRQMWFTDWLAKSIWRQQGDWLMSPVSCRVGKSKVPGGGGLSGGFRVTGLYLTTHYMLHYICPLWSACYWVTCGGLWYPVNVIRFTLQNSVTETRSRTLFRTGQYALLQFHIVKLYKESYPS